MNSGDERRAVVLLSGGLDSATVLAAAKAEGRLVYALSFQYGQRHVAELACAKRHAARAGALRHEIISLEHLGQLVSGKSSLIQSSALAVETERDERDDSIPSTYVPARNTLFLSYALALAEVVDAQEIWLGVNALDYSGYPDCRPEFIEAYERMANLATKNAVQGHPINIVTPLLQLTKAEIIRKGHALRVDYADTISCYHPRALKDGEPATLACGHCESCRLRRKGFAEAKIADPTHYIPDSGNAM